MTTQNDRHRQAAAWVDLLMPEAYNLEAFTRADGAWVRRSTHGDGDRYRFDAALVPRGFRLYETAEDAWYFGVWVHTGRWQVITYAEGDVSVVTCPDAATMRSELGRLAEFHGEPPPSFRVIDVETGSLTHVYDKRPGADDVEERT